MVDRTDFNSVAARQRFFVYQEGQRAYSNGTACPYTDWRAKTWAKGFEAAEQYWADLAAQQKRIDDADDSAP